MTDWVAVTIAGASEPAAAIIRTAASLDGGDGPATVLAVRGGAGVQAAALANGVASHALDFDDGNGWMLGHPSVAICPAALAVAEEIGASGEALLVSILAGVEVATRVGIAMGESREEIGPEWGITQTTFKMHACCGVTHPTIDALRAAQALHGFDAADVERLEIEGGPLAGNVDASGDPSWTGRQDCVNPGS
jgi:2-methylcitrate dehydratase PrpD